MPPDCPLIAFMFDLCLCISNRFPSLLITKKKVIGFLLFLINVLVSCVAVFGNSWQLAYVFCSMVDIFSFFVLVDNDFIA